MCGIAGIFHPDVPKPVQPERLKHMADTLAHRGPDGKGVWTAPGVGLAHRRLAIIDLESGDQPMLSRDGGTVITYNGEIYNFLELRLELEGKGHRFTTKSDTEVILAAWLEWGPGCLKRFNGMFAFAIYDAREDALFLARDRLGVKPLFIGRLPDGAIIFASELKGILAHPLFRRNINPHAIDDFLAFGYVPDDSAIVAGASKLPAGHYLFVKRGQPVPEPACWWDLDFSVRATGKRAALKEQLLHLMQSAVSSRMISDVPLGAFLSGGIDSSSVVALMAEASDRAVETCSIGFEEAQYDESRYARIVAERFATSHRSRVVRASDFSLIDRISDAFDEPFADASALATYRLCELARKKVKVALSGDGADEAFAGYRRYRLFMMEERARKFLPQSARTAAGAIGDIYPRFDWAPRFLRAKTTLQAIGKSSGEAYAEAVGITPSSLRHGIYTDDFSALLKGWRPEDRYVHAMDKAPADDLLSRAQYADMKIWLPGDILTKVDRMSMAVSLEAREPLLDYQLVEFATSLPPNFRLRRGEGKWLMKRAMRAYLPEEIMRRPKMGFVTPIDLWFRNELAAEAAGLARASALSELGWFDPAAISKIASDHRIGRRDHGRLLWQLMMLDRSLQRLFGLGASSGYSAAAK